MPRSETKNPARQIKAKPLARRLITRSVLFVAISLIVCALLGIQATTSYMKSVSPVIRVHTASSQTASSQGKSLLNLQEAPQASVDYGGDAFATAALRTGIVSPVSLAFGDFDGDGAPDLVSGYGYYGGGIIAMRLGNLDAFQTQDLNVYQSALKGEVATSLITRADARQIPEAPDFLMVGDFDGDGRQDVLAGARGGGVYFLAGDGAAGLGAAQQISLNGTVSAVTSGDFNRGSERTSVAVAIDGPGGPGVLMFEGGEGGILSAPTRFPLSAPATALALGKLDNDSFTDLVVAVGDKVEIIHGWGWTNVYSAAQVEEINVPFEVRSLAIGDFIWDREARPELALLSPDGNVHIYERGQLDSRPFTDADKPALYARRVAASRAPMLTLQQQIDLRERDKWEASAKESWSDVQQIAAIPGGGNLSPQTLMTGAHTTGRRTDDLFVLDAQSQQVHILIDQSTVSAPWNTRTSVSLDIDGAPLAVVAMPQKINASRDLLVLSGAHTEAANIGLVPQATFTVTQTADRNSACGTGGQCSLREAINSANSTAGTNTVAFSVNGTFTNTLGQFPAQGDVNSTNITILGSSPANTVIANTGSGVGHSVLYYGFNANQTFKVQNLTLQNGNTGDGFGGGALATGGTGWTVTVDNCVMNNNVSQSTDNGGAISQSGGGNFIIQNNSVISNNTATAAIGGGICVNNSTNVGGLTVTNSSFTGNSATAGAGAGQGGGLWIGVESSGSSVVTITRATITGNAAGSQQGGGIFTNKGTVQFSRIVGNTAVTGGTGIFEPGGGFAVTANNNWWGCNTGPNGAATGGCSVAPNTTSGFTAPTAWLQLRNVISGANVHNANQIAPGSSATFTGDILGLNTGGTTAAANLNGLLTFPTAVSTIYSNSSPALAASFNPTTGQYVNGVATTSAIFVSNSTKGTATVNSIADNQTFGVPLVIGFTPEFVNPAGNDNVGLAFSSAACGGVGFQPCFATVGAALTNVAISGIINIQAGTYAETPDFNQSATTNITGNVTLNSITLTNGTFNASTFTTTLASGNFTNNGGTFTQATSTFAFTPGAGAQTIGGSNATTFNSLTINNASGVNLGNNVTVGGTLTLTNGALGVGTNTLTLNSTVSFASGTITSGATGTVNYNQGSNGQAVAPGSYGNLTFSNFNKTLPPSGTVGIASTFTTGTAVGHTITNSTVDFNGTGAQTVPAFNFNNLTISGVRTGANNVTLVNLGTIGVAGTFNPTATFGTGNYVSTGNTFDFNGTGAQTVPALGTAGYNNLTISGARTTNNVTLANGGTIRIAGTFSLTASFTSGNYVVTNNTIDFNGTGAQTIPALGTVGYNNLTISGARTGANSVTLVNGGTILIAGAFSPTATFGTGNYVTTNNTVNFGSTGAQTIPGLGTSGYNNLTISGARTTNNITLVNGGTIRISAVFSPTATFTSGVYVLTGNTIEYNGGALQTLPSSGFNTYNNLTINNTVGATGFAGLTVNGLLDVAKGTFTSSSTYNNVQVDNTGTLAGTAATTINVTGNWTINTGGAFTPNGNTVNFNGSGAQTIGGTATTAAATTFNNLTIANAGSGVTLGQNETVNGTLTLTNDLNTSTFTLTQPSTAPASAGTGDVVGNIKRTNAPNPLPNSALTYGNFNNTIGFASGTAPTDITIKLTKTAPTDAATGQTNSGWPAAILRTYVITPTGGSGFSATMQLHYNAGDLNGNTAGNLKLWKLIANGWSEQSASVDNGSGVGVSLSGMSGFSPWTMADSVVPTAANGNVSGQIVDSNGNPVEGAAVRMNGTENRLTVTDATGNYHFDNVETNGFYTVVPTRANFNFSPSQRAFSQLGQHTDAAFSATPTGNALNPLDTTEYFVRQQYVDFLNREPDESGFNFWVNNIESCGSDANCRAVKRIDTSAAFFLSIEFQQTGYLVYRTYQAAYGDLPNAPVPIRRNEFKPDTAEIGNGVVVLQSGWQARLESNTQAFVSEFVQRARFVSAYPGTMTPAEFVDQLFSNAGVTPGGADRAAAINEFGAASTTSDVAARGRALRRVAENATLGEQEFNQAFVLMEYFGYLQRDADTGPDTDFTGYNFWLGKLNTFGGNFQNADMVKSFLVSGEYRGRFPR